jgi:DNA replication protein DnaC
MKKPNRKTSPLKKHSPERLTSSLERARSLGLWGIVNAWEELRAETWIEEILDIEENERKRRSLERRITSAKIGRFTPIADFDWLWPKKIDRDHMEDVLRLDFLSECANVILLGPNGVGKTTMAQNIAYGALLAGHTVRMTTASELLCDLAIQDGPLALSRRIRRYTKPALLVIDELGYLFSPVGHADLLFEIISRRYKEGKSVVLTTNKAFSEWGEIFPNAACVTTLIDRLTHRCEIVKIDGDSYRHKESQERQSKRRKPRPVQDDKPL